MLLGFLDVKSCVFGLCFGQSFLPLLCFAWFCEFMMIGREIMWMLWKLGRIDGDPALRGKRIWATWEYVSSVGGGQQGMMGLYVICVGSFSSELLILGKSYSNFTLCCSLSK